MDSNPRHKQRNKFRFSDFIIIVLFLSITAVCLYLFRLDLLNTFSRQNEEPVGTVIIKKNTVQRRLSDRIAWDRLKNESPVYAGDLIRVAEVSSATIYIQDNGLDLDENTLIRISPSPEGEGWEISLGYGTLAFFAGEGAKSVLVNLNGEQRKPEPGTVLHAVMPENGQASVKVYESTDQFIREKPLRKIPEPRLLSPAVNSIIRYRENFPVLNFRWTNIEEVSSYILQVSNSSDFSNLRISKKTSAVSVSINELGQGVWFWRVKLDLPPMYNASPVYSNVSFFRIEQTAGEPAEPANNVSIAQWLADEAPSTKPPLEVPQEILESNFIFVPSDPPPVEMPVTAPPPAQAQSAVQTQPVQPRQTPARATTPPPPALLPVPRIIQPLQRTTYGYEQLQTQRRVDFRWSAVQGANAYIFTLYQQTANGRRQILRTTINNGARYTLDNLRLLDRGTFVWQVEAVRMRRGNVIEQRGRTADNIFIIDFPAPSPVEIEDTGILYGN
jgi:hypothetical protein